MNWETQEAFDARLSERRLNVITPTPLRVWYHAACMGNYRDVIREHAAVFSALDLCPTACVLGDSDGLKFVESIWPVAYHGERFGEFETPTLQRLWEDCRANPTGAVMYVHSKGVSAPTDPVKAAWRRLMTRHVVGRWRENLDKLAIADILGVDWQQSASYPHFQGNFWMARADWIARLDSPTEHRARGGPWIAGQMWDRMHAEMWVGSKAYHQVESLVCTDWDIWSGHCMHLMGPSYKSWL